MSNLRNVSWLCLAPETSGSLSPRQNLAHAVCYIKGGSTQFCPSLQLRFLSSSNTNGGLEVFLETEDTWKEGRVPFLPLFNICLGNRLDACLSKWKLNERETARHREKYKLSWLNVHCHIKNVRDPCGSKGKTFPVTSANSTHVQIINTTAGADVHLENVMPVLPVCRLSQFLSMILWVPLLHCHHTHLTWLTKMINNSWIWAMCPFANLSPSSQHAWG